MAKNNGILEITFADGKTIEVQTTLEDRLAFEAALRKNKGWGKLEDSILKMPAFQAWHAAHRLSLTELTWAEFTTGDTAAINVGSPDEDDEDDDELEVYGLGKDTPKTPSTTSQSSSPVTTAERPGNGEENADLS